MLVNFVDGKIGNMPIVIWYEDPFKKFDRRVIWLKLIGGDQDSYKIVLRKPFNVVFGQEYDYEEVLKMLDDIVSCTQYQENSVIYTNYYDDDYSKLLSDTFKSITTYFTDNYDGRRLNYTQHIAKKRTARNPRWENNSGSF